MEDRKRPLSEEVPFRACFEPETEILTRKASLSIRSFVVCGLYICEYQWVQGDHHAGAKIEVWC